MLQALFDQLYVSMQNRDSDLDEFFAHEIQSFPPSLSDFGKLHLPSSKSDLLKCLEQREQPEPPSSYDCKVLDGAVIINFLPTAGVGSFNEYADRIFVPYVQNQLKDASRLDVVWDTYIPQFEGVYTRKERRRCAQESVCSNQTAT